MGWMGRLTQKSSDALYEERERYDSYEASSRRDGEYNERPQGSGACGITERGWRHAPDLSDSASAWRHTASLFAATGGRVKGGWVEGQSLGVAYEG